MTCSAEDGLKVRHNQGAQGSSCKNEGRKLEGSR